MALQWTIVQLDVYPTKGALTDVVCAAHWICADAQVVDGVTATGQVASVCLLPAPSPNQFVPYADLTEDEVLAWIWANGVDRSATEAAVAQQIAEKLNPPVVVLPMPWAGA